MKIHNSLLDLSQYRTDGRKSRWQACNQIGSALHRRNNQLATATLFTAIATGKFFSRSPQLARRGITLLA